MSAARQQTPRVRFLRVPASLAGRLAPTLFLAPALLLAPTAGAQVGNKGVQAYGWATAGTGGKLPVMWANEAPRPGGANFAMTITDGRPSSPALPYVSLAQADFRLGGVGVLIDFQQSVLMGLVTLDANGGAILKLPLPNTSSLIGAVAYTQTFIADNGGAPLGFAATQGVRLRIKRSEVLLGAGGTTQIAIDLQTGSLATFGSVGSSNDVAFLVDGSHCVVADQGRMVHLLSAPAAAPPTLVQSANTQAGVAPWSVTLNPDGARMYVVNQGPANSNPTIEALWGIVGPTFGTPFGTSNNTIPLGTVIDGLRILFSPDGKRGYFGALGLFAGGADLRIYDTDPSSATLHQQITNRQWAGEFMFGFAVSPRGDMVATASAGLGLNSNIHLMDPAALISLPAVNPPLGRVVKELEFGPLGRHLFVLNGNEVRRVLVDQAAPPSQYGSSVAYTTGLPTSNTGVNDIELDDTGTRLYVSASNGVFEYDVATQALLRSWPTPTNRLAYR